LSVRFSLKPFRDVLPVTSPHGKLIARISTERPAIRMNASNGGGPW
jgi:hypothetical protein